MDELMEILEEIRPDVDFGEETELIDRQILSSLDVISIVTEISDAYGITVSPMEIIPANFNSAEAIWGMIGRLRAR